MKKNYSILLEGCDDETTFTMELAPEEFALMQKVSEKSMEVSQYGCMPTMEIEEA